MENISYLYSMKKLKLTIAGVLLGFAMQAQGIYTLEKTDSVAKTKDQIYSDTKIFITEYWKSAKEVIQNDDKEQGIIIIKGTCHEIARIGTGIDVWYSYNVKFLMKDGKYKIILNNLKIDLPSGWAIGNPSIYDVPTIPQISFPGAGKTNFFNEKKWLELITAVDNDMKNIIAGYEKSIKINSAW
jgi:hypothetical protein